jgi:tetratricopeptide (TPR) repeat protein
MSTRITAITLLLAWTALSPGAPLTEATPALLKAARDARRAGNLDEAEARLKEYESRRGDPEAARQEWLLLRAQRGEKAAQKELRAALKEKRIDVSLGFEALTRGYITGFRYADAAAALDEWLEREPKSADALLLRAQRRADLGQLDDAEADFSRALEIQPDRWDVRLRLAEVMCEQHKYDEAASHFVALRKSRKDEPGPVLGLARCRSNLGDNEEAVKLLDDLLAKQPKLADVLRERGRLAEILNEHEKAEACLRKAKAANPHDHLADLWLELCLAQLGRKAEAMKLAEERRRFERELIRLDDLIKQVAKSPDEPKPRHEAGDVCARLGRDEEALRWWKSALNEKSDFEPAHRSLADYYEKAGKKDLAAQHRKLAGSTDKK